MVISPATNALPSTACFDSFTSVALISTNRSCNPYSSSLILFPVNVGAYTMCEPASTYSLCILISTSGCSITQFSGQTPIGIPASIRFVPVAPSKMIGPFSFINLANSAFVISFSSFSILLGRFVRLYCFLAPSRFGCGACFTLFCFFNPASLNAQSRAHVTCRIVHLYI